MTTQLKTALNYARDIFLPKTAAQDMNPHSQKILHCADKTRTATSVFGTVSALYAASALQSLIPAAFAALASYGCYETYQMARNVQKIAQNSTSEQLSDNEFFAQLTEGAPVAAKLLPQVVSTATLRNRIFSPKPA